MPALLYLKDLFTHSTPCVPSTMDCTHQVAVGGSTRGDIVLKDPRQQQATNPSELATAMSNTSSGQQQSSQSEIIPSNNVLSIHQPSLLNLPLKPPPKFVDLRWTANSMHKSTGNSHIQQTGQLNFPTRPPPRFVDLQWTVDSTQRPMGKLQFQKNPRWTANNLQEPGKHSGTGAVNEAGLPFRYSNDDESSANQYLKFLDFHQGLATSRAAANKSSADLCDDAKSFDKTRNQRTVAAGQAHSEALYSNGVWGNADHTDDITKETFLPDEAPKGGVKAGKHDSRWKSFRRKLESIFGCLGRMERHGAYKKLPETGQRMSK